MRIENTTGVRILVDSTWELQRAIMLAHELRRDGDWDDPENPGTGEALCCSALTCEPDDLPDLPGVFDDMVDVLRRTDDEGREWRLACEEGDVYAVCVDLLDNDTHALLFGCLKPPPPEALVYAVCMDCINFIAYGELRDDSAPDYDGEIIAGEKRLMGENRYLVADAGDLGFGNQPCDCCDSGAGDRWRVFAMPKPVPAPMPDDLI